MCMWSGVTVTLCRFVQCLPGASPTAIWAHLAHRHLFCTRPLGCTFDIRWVTSHIVTHRRTSSFGDIFAVFCYLQEHPIVESGWSAAIRVPCRLCGGGRSSTTVALGMAGEEVCKGVHMNLHDPLGDYLTTLGLSLAKTWRLYGHFHCFTFNVLFSNGIDAKT